jgi:hypothetical protein
MVTRQERFSAARLRDGRVLLVGPSGWELYDPATGTWSATAGDMPGYAGTGTSAVVLRDGRVLLGESVYDPASGTWTSTNPVPWKSWGLATVTRLRDGRVLAAKYGVAMLYDPATGAWAPTGKPKVVSEMAAATLLSDGKVLVAGGYDDEHGLLDSAEVYDPVTGSWTEIANMPASGGRTATLLRDGKVLVAGTAMAEGGVAQGVARLYDPATGTWTELPLRPGIHGFDSAALFADDTVLLTKSWHADAHCATLDVYDSRTGSWTTVSGIPWCNVSSFTPLLDGTLLVAGGSDCNGVGDCVPNGAAALYVPAGVPLPPLPDFPSAPPPLFPSPTATPSPTPRPTSLPPAAGPVPPNARSWTVTVENRSSEPAAAFVADEDGDGLRLVGAATPNVVPAGATVEVTFLFAADGGWIYVNPRPGEGGALVNADDIGVPGKIVVTADGQVGWLSP